MNEVFREPTGEREEAGFRHLLSSENSNARSPCTRQNRTLWFPLPLPPLCISYLERSQGSKFLSTEVEWPGGLPGQDLTLAFSLLHILGKLSCILYPNRWKGPPNAGTSSSLPWAASVSFLTFQLLRYKSNTS